MMRNCLFGIRGLCLTLVVGLSAVTAQAQTFPTKDVQGSRDHPLAGRYEGSFIAYHKVRDYDEMRLPIKKLNNSRVLTEENSIEIKGRALRQLYRGPQGRSSLEVVRNYEQRLQGQGFETLFLCRMRDCGGSDLWFAVTEAHKGSGLPSNWESQTYLIARKKDGNGAESVVAVLSVEISGEVRSLVDVLESKGMETDKIKVLDAGALKSALDGQGRAALYGITFEFNKAEIRSESRPQIDQIVAYLKANPQVAIVVAGHTDAKGGFDYNVDLSRRRAQAVVQALTAAGIGANRLTPFGAGMASPVATNETEAGQAQNRRVEIVKR
ncbi:OmpA family protein [Rhabdaerophilum sp. SD176]|uniref:OmpA family protein n=1 Tax=Rhabdaerophilum sp. SD176 TaxID=2983548 RepID=UPI0024E01691|nr:OmpA family protein [Rhabdaerophilum sp. SD176]